MMRKAGSISARACSGSMPSIRSIEPLISANSAVTVLRSPSGSCASSTAGRSVRVGRLVGPDAGNGVLAEEAAPTRAPHWIQNFALGGFSAPHDTHRDSSAAPHSAQNFAFAALSVSHFEHRIRLARGPSAVDYEWLSGGKFTFVAGEK